MTGQNKYVLSVFSRLIHTKMEDLYLILIMCQDILTRQDIKQLLNIGIPVIPLNFTTKQQVLDYILNEVKEFVPVVQNMKRRSVSRAFNRLGKAILKTMKLC